jgi:hypothetical protein
MNLFSSVPTFLNNNFVIFCLPNQLFQRILNHDKARTGGNMHNFLMGPSIEVRIRRSSLYQDAFDELGGDQGKR